MDRSGVLIVVVGCVFIAAAGALVTLKNAKQHADADLETTEQQASPEPRQNPGVAEQTPTIEPIPPVAPPVTAQHEPDESANTATGSATTTAKAAATDGVEEGKTIVAGDVSNAQSVVASMGPGFRRCYNNGLQTNPNMKGSLRITARIGPNGDVVVANPSGGNGLSKEVIDCVVNRVKSARFSPPVGGGATIVLPVSFVSQ